MGQVGDNGDPRRGEYGKVIPGLVHQGVPFLFAPPSNGPRKDGHVGRK